MMSFFVYILFFLLLVFFYNFFSFLNSLLILESFSLMIFIFVMLYGVSVLSLKFSLFYFVFLVCESCIGLSILVKCIKIYGSSNFLSMGFLMF